ncbi:MAG: hypothetical protein GY859_07685 [Desulfobacterales bacterium]|nr:hypothetical protein [Desulfobacterales bacterium]
MLDGNCLETTRHCIKELRNTAFGALPGKSLVVYDHSRRLPIDVFPREYGHAQEMSMLADVLSSVQDPDVWIYAHNFRVLRFLFGIAVKAFFTNPQHAELAWKATGNVKYWGSS